MKYPIKKIKSDFPIFNKNKNLIYLDNASTTHKPICSIKNEFRAYSDKYAPYNRGLYKSSYLITKEVEESRKFIAKFINSNYKEIIFTKGSTECINIISNSLGKKILSNKDNIIISEIEHHSNILPWIIISKEIGFKINFLKINKNNGILNIDKLKDIINKNTKIVSLTHVSNILGIINPIEDIISIVKKINNKIIVIIDGSQSIMHIKIDVKKINCDFFFFSGHKIYGPLGIGILYGKINLLNYIPPFEFGGSMIKDLNIKNKKIIYMETPWKFESGSINFPSIIGLKHSIKYLINVGIKNIIKWENKLLELSIEELKKIKNIKIYGSKNIKNKVGIISFNIKNINDFDIALMLNKFNICIRTGHHCSIPTLKIYKTQGICRISYAMYNDFNDILIFIEKLNYIIKLFKK